MSRKNEDFRQHVEELGNIFSSLEDENLYEDGELDEVSVQKKFRSLILRMTAVYLKMGQFFSPEDVELYLHGSTVMGTEVRVLKKKVRDLEEQLARSVTWDVDDFVMRAKYHEKANERGAIFDYTKMDEALKTMISKHDASIGICWDVVDFWLYEICFNDQEGDHAKATSDCSDT